MVEFRFRAEEKILEWGSPSVQTTGGRALPLLHTAWCSLWCMRTNIDIDDEVLHEAQRLLGTRTKKATVDLALRELVARHRQIGVLDLRGCVRWEGNLADSRLPRA